MDRTVSTRNVKLSALSRELAACGKINWATASQMAITITESTAQMMRTRRRWRGPAGVGEALPVFPSTLGSDILPSLIIRYGYRSGHEPGGGHRPAKTIGRFAIVATRDIAVPDVGVAGWSRAELELDDVGLWVLILITVNAGNIRVAGGIVRNPKDRDANEYRLWLFWLWLNGKLMCTITRCVLAHSP